jgi:hypothetical protein
VRRCPIGWRAYLRLLDPTLTDERDAAGRHVEDPAEAARVQALPLPAPDVQVRWAATTTAGTAADLAVRHTSLGAAEPPTAREHLEWQPPPAGYAGLGFEGGSLPGVLTEAVTVRRDDGTTGVGVLLVEGMDVDEWTQALASALPHQQLLIGALTDPAAQLRAADPLGVLTGDVGPGDPTPVELRRGGGPHSASRAAACP